MYIYIYIERERDRDRDRDRDTHLLSGVRVVLADGGERTLAPSQPRNPRTSPEPLDSIIRSVMIVIVRIGLIISMFVISIIISSIIISSSSRAATRSSTPPAPQ